MKTPSPVYNGSTADVFVESVIVRIQLASDSAVAECHRKTPEEVRGVVLATVEQVALPISRQREK
jgi:hypothetical protein